MKTKKSDPPNPRSNSKKKKVPSANNKKKVTFYINEALIKEVKKLAIDKNANNSTLVEEALEAYVRRQSRRI